MTQDEKTTLANEYAQTCAKIGDAIIARDIAESMIIDMKSRARDLLNKIKSSEVNSGTRDQSGNQSQ